MTDRYQDKSSTADDDYDGGTQHAPAKGESDPLAELARLIGQTDPFAMGRANQPVAPRTVRAISTPRRRPMMAPPLARRHGCSAPPGRKLPAGLREGYPSAVHPLHRYAAQAAAEPDYHPAPPFADAEHEADPARYDDALYGQLDTGAQDTQHDPAYPDDPYAYQDGYGDAEDQPPKRGGGMITVVVVLALAVLGTGAAFAYRTYMGSPRGGEPPIIRADAGPTKVVPAPMDANAKLPDRMAAGDGTEKIVPREEAPVDVNAKSGPRVVFPPLNQNANPPSAASVPGGAPPATAGNGTLPSSEPRKIKTFSVPGDQANGAAGPVMAPATAPAAPSAKPAAARCARRTPASPAPARSPPRLPTGRQCAALAVAAGRQPAPAAPAAAEPRTRVAATAPEPRPAAQAAAADTWSRSRRSGAKPTRRPPTARCRASSRRCSARARR